MATSYTKFGIRTFDYKFGASTKDGYLESMYRSRQRNGRDTELEERNNNKQQQQQTNCAYISS